MSKDKESKAKVSKANTSKEYSAPALEKGIDILELLAKSQSGLKVNDIADSLSRTRAEIVRMIAVLAKRHYIEYDESTHLYSLSLRMFAISHLHAPVNNLSNVAKPAMTKLAELSNRTCHLVVPMKGGCVIVAEQTPLTSITNLSFPVGGIGGLLPNCAGHIFLAYADEAEREKMLNDFVDLHGDSALKMQTLTSTLDRVKKQGYEMMPSPVILGVIDTGYPVFNHQGNVIAALMICSLQYMNMPEQPEIDDITQYMSDAAQAISKELGYKGTE